MQHQTLNTQQAQHRLDELRVSARVADDGRRNCQVLRTGGDGAMRVRLEIRLGEDQSRMLRGQFLDRMGFS